MTQSFPPPKNSYFDLLNTSKNILGTDKKVDDEKREQTGFRFFFFFVKYSIAWVLVGYLFFLYFAFMSLVESIAAD